LTPLTKILRTPPVWNTVYISLSFKYTAESAYIADENMVSHCRELTGVNCGELYMSYKSIFQDVRDAVDFVHDSVSLAPGSLHWRRQAGQGAQPPFPMDGQKEFYSKKWTFEFHVICPRTSSS